MRFTPTGALAAGALRGGLLMPEVRGQQAPAGKPRTQTASPFEPLLPVFCVGEPCCTMRLEPLGRTWKLAFHIAFGALNIVSEDVESCPIALRLNSHCFLRLWSHRVTHAHLSPEACCRLHHISELTRHSLRLRIAHWMRCMARRARCMNSQRLDAFLGPTLTPWPRATPARNIRAPARFVR